MAKAEEYLSQSKYAEHRSVTKGYIGRLVKEGRLHLIKGKLNVEMSDAEQTPEVQHSKHTERENVNFYEAFGGEGDEDVYLSDGIYIRPDGSHYDERG